MATLFDTRNRPGRRLSLRKAQDCQSSFCFPTYAVGAPAGAPGPAPAERADLPSPASCRLAGADAGARAAVRSAGSGD